MTTITKFKIQGAWTTTEKGSCRASIDAVIASLTSLSLIIDRGSSNKKIEVSPGGWIRVATLPLDHPEMEGTIIRSYTLRDSYPDSLLIKLENVPGVNDAGVVVRVKYHGINSGETVGKIADTIRRTYLSSR